MVEKEWIEIGTVIGDTGPKGDTGDIGIGTVVKGHYNNYADFINVHPSGSLGDAYIVNGNYYYWNENGWANAGSIKGDTGETGVKGDKGDTGPAGTGVTIKGSYNTYEELVIDHPTGSEGDSYLVNGSLYVWNGSAWENVGNIKGEKGDTGETGAQGIQGVKGDTGSQGIKGDKGDTGATGPATDENAGWKLPVDAILTTNTLPTGVSKGYRVAICTNSVLAIKEYNGTSWETENLVAYSIIPLKHSGSIQMYLAKNTGPVYMGVDYGVFGKFRFMTQAAYNALGSYDEDTIYFVRS